MRVYSVLNTRHNKTKMTEQTNKQNKQIETGFLITLKPITKKGLIDNLNDYAIINKLQ